MTLSYFYPITLSHIPSVFSVTPFPLSRLLCVTCMSMGETSLLDHGHRRKYHLFSQPITVRSPSGRGGASVSLFPHIILFLGVNIHYGLTYNRYNAKQLRCSIWFSTRVLSRRSHCPAFIDKASEFMGRGEWQRAALLALCNNIILHGPHTSL